MKTGTYSMLDYMVALLIVGFSSACAATFVTWPEFPEWLKQWKRRLSGSPSPVTVLKKFSRAMIHPHDTTVREKFLKKYPQYNYEIIAFHAAWRFNETRWKHKLFRKVDHLAHIDTAMKAAYEKRVEEREADAGLNIMNYGGRGG